MWGQPIPTAHQTSSPLGPHGSQGSPRPLNGAPLALSVTAPFRLRGSEPAPQELRADTPLLLEGGTMPDMRTTASRPAAAHILDGHRRPRLYRGSKAKRFGAERGVRKPRNLGGTCPARFVASFGT